MSVTTTASTQNITEWTRVFPRQVAENYTSSVTFMKQLTIVAVSAITYFKNVFPEENYTVEAFAGFQLRILNKKCKDELAQFLSTSLAQSFEAFNKKYLHRLVLCFYDGDCHVDNLVEYHIFEYSYNSEGVTMNIHSKNKDNGNQTKTFEFNNIKTRTVQLLRVLVVLMETAYKLPSTYEISLRLYYNDDAPNGYQAPGFAALAESEDHLESTIGEALKMGCVETPFHKLVARSYIRESVEPSNEVNPSLNPPVMTQYEDEMESGRTSETSVPMLRCPCNKYGDEDANTPLLVCEYCSTLQHPECFGVLPPHAARRPRHCCAICYDADSTRRPTDAQLAQLQPKQRQGLSVFRRTLVMCSRRATLECRALEATFNMSRANALKLMQLLQSSGILEQYSDAEPETPRIINPNRLNAEINKHFYSEESIADRLEAETLSQRSQPDPVANVLGSVGNLSLQNATTMAKIIEPSSEKLLEEPSSTEKLLQDMTLKQYKEAILSEQRMEEELPLSGRHNPVKDMGNIGKKTTKRKASDKANTQLAGVKTKRAKAMPA